MGRTLTTANYLAVFSAVLFVVAHFVDPGPLVDAAVSSGLWTCTLLAQCLPIAALFLFLTKTHAALEPRRSDNRSIDRLLVPSVVFLGGCIAVSAWVIFNRISWALQHGSPDSLWATTAVDHVVAFLQMATLVLSVPTLRLWKTSVVAMVTLSPRPVKDEEERKKGADEGKKEQEKTGEQGEETEEEEEETVEDGQPGDDQGENQDSPKRT